ncbi:MAG: T9SS C-terminal target domain-containing protein, partial [Bacteroidetes bacterium]
QTALKVFPNPTTDVVYIQSDESVYIYSLSGKLVKKIDAAPKNITVSNLEKGIYFVKSKNKMVKLIKF